MELVRYLHGGTERCGVADGDRIVEVDWSLRDALVLLATGEGDRIRESGVTTRARDEVALLAPTTATSRIFCVGINYLDHQEESRDVFMAKVPEAPVVFLKDLSSVAPPTGELVLPASTSTEFDWEVELGVVIGAPARAVSEDEAWGVVAGYTVVNDVSVRDRQVRHVQWTLGKNAPVSTPIGPGIVSRDAMGIDPEVAVEFRLNGVTKQQANTRDLIFDIPRLIAEISAVTPLLPGDIIATGTPAGVGFKRNPPEFLTEGDTLETSISGVGTLRHTIRTGASA